MSCSVCGTGQKHEPCEDCGRIVHVGFEPFFDEGLGMTVTGFGDINKECRPKWEQDHIVHIQPRDKSPQYYRELNERRAERANRR